MPSHDTSRSILTAGRACAAGFVLLVAAFPARAQAPEVQRNHLYDKLEVAAAATFVLDRSEARVDSPEGMIGTTISIPNSLGLPGTTVQPAVGLRWRPGRRTALELSYQFLNKSGERTIERNLDVGGDTVYAGLQAASALSSDDATLQFKYALWAADRHTIGVAVGLGAIFFHLTIHAMGDASGGGGSVADTVRIDKSLTGPTASIGAFGNWRLGSRWYVGADARAFEIRIDRYGVSVLEGNLDARYYLSDRWGVGASVYYTDVALNVDPQEVRRGDATDLFGSVKHAYTSLRLGAVAAF